MSDLTAHRRSILGAASLALPGQAHAGGFEARRVIFFYFPEKLSRDPWILLKLFDGMSSVGGFLGALVGGVAFLRLWCARRPVGAQPVPIYADVSTYGLLIGWCFGRAGCWSAPSSISPPRAPRSPTASASA